MSSYKGKLAVGALLLIFLLGSATSNNLTAQDGSGKIYDESEGWAIEANFSDKNVAPIMEVILDGESHGKAAFIKIYHESQNYTGSPEVAIIYSSGYIRLKQNADPDYSIPFGGSFVLGPAYNGTNTTVKAYEYSNNPQLVRLEIDTSQLPDLPLVMKATGSNRDFNVTYDILMPPPTDESTQLHVNQTYKANDDITINQTAKQLHEGFKLVQFSSMFINEGGIHDSNAARYMGQTLVEQAFRNLTIPSHIFDNPEPLSQLWLDLLHVDDDSWHFDEEKEISGNTPNLRITLDDRYDGAILVPQGWIEKTSDPNDDNVGLWIHDDGNASVSWSKGQEGQIGYWLLAQDNPPEIA